MPDTLAELQSLLAREHGTDNAVHNDWLYDLGMFMESHGPALLSELSRLRAVVKTIADPIHLGRGFSVYSSSLSPVGGGPLIDGYVVTRDGESCSPHFLTKLEALEWFGSQPDALADSAREGKA